MKSEPQTVEPQREGLMTLICAAVFGGFLGLALLKFGNPPIMEHWVSVPKGFWEVLLSSPWPIAWAYWLLLLVVCLDVLAAPPKAKFTTGVMYGLGGFWLKKLVTSFTERRNSSVPSWLIALPVVWLFWQFLAGTQTVNGSLTAATLKHFIACIVCFYLGVFSLSRVKNLWCFWVGLLCGFLLVLAFGWEQQCGGLDASRRYFFVYAYEPLKDWSPDKRTAFLKRITSNRIFSTLFYPNALAGALLLLLPATLAALWQLRGLLTAAARGFLILLVGIAGLACLYWSGSKGGWLLMLLLVGTTVLLRVKFSKRFKVLMVTVVLLTGLAGFFLKYKVYFEKGATSVSARFDYWKAAFQTAMDKPLFGTGPGTFLIAYEKIKLPGSEDARLVHNDYLEQASDSGWMGLAIYAAFIGGSLWWGFPRRGKNGTNPSDDWLTFALWLGVLGWSLQGLVEFGLYIPALAWPAFTLLGWLLGRIRPTPAQAPCPVTDH